jgi:hypothetical protein
MLTWIVQNNGKLCLTFFFFSFFTRLISLTLLPNYDEWYYLASWNSLQNGGVLYKTILDNKPPLAYFLYAIPDTFSLYITLSILSAVIACFIYKIADNLYAGHVFLFITGAIPSYLELNLEYWVLACILPAYYYLLKKESVLWHRWAYFLCGASLMIKQHSLLFIIPLVIYAIANNRKIFYRSIYFIAILPVICFFYILYTDTFYNAYVWIIEFNFWYKDLSETGGYIWKRFVYGQFFAVFVYIGLILSLKNIQKKSLHFVFMGVLALGLGSVWIGKELFLHYQLLVFPFLVLLFYQISIQKHRMYVYTSTLCIFIFGQASCMYTYMYSQKTWLTRTEGVISYQEKKQIKPLPINKPLVFSAQSTVGLDYHKVKYIALCKSLEYLKRKNTTQKQLLSCDFYIQDAIYIVPKLCLKEYVGDLKYNIVYEYEENVGVEIEKCQ